MSNDKSFTPTSRAVSITLYPNGEGDEHGKAGKTTIDELYAKWRDRAEVPADTPKKGRGAFVPGVMAPGAPSTERTKSLSFICVEVDNTKRVRIDGKWETVPVDPEVRIPVAYAVKVLRRLRLDAVIYTTYSHTPELPKFRVLISISRDLTPDEATRAQVYLHARLAGRIDANTKNIGRLWYSPIRRAGHVYEVHRIEALPLDVDAFLARLPAEPERQAAPALANTRLATWINDLKATIDLRELVEHDGHTAKKRSASYSAFFSPFRDDGSKPAFVVWEDHAYDFGTSETFDAVSYTRKAKSLDFWSALDALADYAGIPHVDRKAASRPALIDPRPLIDALPEALPETGREPLLRPIYEAIATQDEEDRVPFVRALVARTKIARNVVEKGVREAAKSFKSEQSARNEAQRNADPSATRYVTHEGRLSALTAEGTPVPLCSGDVRVTEITHEKIGDDIRDVFTIEATPIGGTPITCKVPTSEFDKMDWLTPQTGGRVYAEPGRGTKDTLRHGIQCLSTPTSRTVYQDFGWHRINNQYVFAHAGGVIGATDIEVCPLDPKLGVYDLTSDPKLVRQGISSTLLELAHVGPARITGPGIASMLHIPLTPALPDRAALVLIGGTGTRKTSFAVELTKAFGRVMSGRDLYSLETTITAAEVVLHAAQNFPVTLDDAWPKGSGREAEAQKRTCRTILHTYYNGQARRRANKDASIKMERAPRCGLWLTAETDIADPGDGESTSNRVIKIAFAPGDINLDMLTTCQEHGDARRAMMAEFITYLVEHPSWRTELPKTYAQHLTHARRLRIGDRHAEVVAALNTTLTFWGTWAEQYVDKSVVRPEIERLMKGLISSCAEQKRRTEDEKPSARYLEAIRTLVRTGRVRVKKEPSASLEGGPVPDVGWVLHESGGTVYYFERGALHGALTRLCADSQEPAPAAVKYVYPDLVREGLALTDGNAQHHGIRRTLGGAKTWYLAFRAETIDQLEAEEREKLATLSEQSKPSVEDEDEMAKTREVITLDNYRRTAS